MTKPFSFTYSKLKNYEQCPRQHEAVDIKRLPGLEPSGEAITYGNKVHAAFKKALKDNEPLPNDMKHLQYWVDWVKSLPGDKYVEEKWGLSREFQETDFFQSRASMPWPWMRMIVDVAVVTDTVGWLVDWKTGKRLEEPLQLWLGAALMFQKFPMLQVIDSMFVWLKEDDGKNSAECISAETIKRSDIEDIWAQVLPRVGIYEDAVATGVFLPKPGNHCRWCRVQSCEFFGKGN